MNILMIGDICGKVGRRAAKQYIPQLSEQYRADLVIANGENAAGGIGLTKKVLDEIFASGVHVVTSGNHIWDKKEIYDCIDREPYLVRPANYPPGTPGQGYCVIEVLGRRVGIVNLSGRTFMPDMDCPFRKADAILDEIAACCDFILFDFHAEATSEKMAMGWYLDGKVTAVVGTHTHIQTSDARILPEGTAYITDLGMVGPWNSVLGMEKTGVLKKFISGMPVRFETAEGPAVFCGVCIEIDDETRRVAEIRRILIHE